MFTCTVEFAHNDFGYKQGYHTVLRFVLVLQYYVLENITVLICDLCPYFLFSVA